MHAEDHDVAKLVDVDRDLGVVVNRDLVAELLEVTSNCQPFDAEGRFRAVSRGYVRKAFSLR